LSVSAAAYALKAAAAASVLALAALVAKLAPARGVSPLRAAAFVALNPLVLVHVVGGGHNDGLAVLVTMLGVAAVVSARELSGGVGLTVAAVVKSSSAVVAPFALLGSKRRGKLVLGALVATAATVTVADLAFGWHWLDAIGLVGKNQSHTSHTSIPTTAARLTSLNPGAVRIGALTLYSAAVAYLLVWTYRGNDWLRAAAWATFGLLLATSWLLPWYLIWPCP
jgi:predicted membrane-bound dolichyl-phosphate-mannose-protein mannosyltransferase